MQNAAEFKKQIKHHLSTIIKGLGLADEFAVVRIQSSLPDGTAVAFIGDRKRRAVLLVSPKNFPAVVNEAQRKAALMRAHLGDRLGSVIQQPLAEGDLLGRSFAIVDYQHPISQNRVIWRLQRSNIAAQVLAWLHGLAGLASENSDVCSRYSRNLEHLCDLNLDAPVRRAAEVALQRLSKKMFRPCIVPMHGDLWRGNILRRWNARRSALHPYDIVIIDWRGSRIDGFPIFDLVQLAASFGFAPHILKRELGRAAQCLGCDITDTRSYVLAALGEIALTLDQFPFEHFRQLALIHLTELERIGV